MSVGRADLVDRSQLHMFLLSLSSANMPLADWLDRLNDGIGVTTYLASRPRHPEDLANWKMIRSQCEPGESLEKLTLGNFANGRGHPPVVTLTSQSSSCRAGARSWASNCIHSSQEHQGPSRNSKNASPSNLVIPAPSRCRRPAAVDAAGLAVQRVAVVEAQVVQGMGDATNVHLAAYFATTDQTRLTRPTGQGERTLFQGLSGAWPASPCAISKMD